MKTRAIFLSFCLGSSFIPCVECDPIQAVSTTKPSSLAATTTQPLRTTIAPPTARTTTAPPTVTDLVIATIPPIECPSAQSVGSIANVSYAEITPDLSLGVLHGVNSVVVRAANASPTLFRVTDGRLVSLNSTGGNWGVFSNGTLSYTPVDCSATFLFEFHAPAKSRKKRHKARSLVSGRERRATAVDDTVEIDITLHLRDGSAIPPGCHLSLIARCTDTKDPENNDDVQLPYRAVNEYGGACAFRKADDLNQCLGEIKALTNFLSTGKEAQDNIKSMFDLGKVEGICARVAGIPTPSAASAIALSACLATMSTLNKLWGDRVQDAIPEQVCRAMGIDDDSSLFEIDVYNIAAGGSPIIFSTTITGMVPTDIRTALNLFSDQAGCSSTTSTTTSTTSTTTSTTPESAGPTCPAGATCDSGTIPTGCYILCMFRYGVDSDTLGSGGYQTPPTCRLPAGQRQAACQSAYDQCTFSAGTNSAALVECNKEVQDCYDAHKWEECDCTLDVCRSQLK